MRKEHDFKLQALKRCKGVWPFHGALWAQMSVASLLNIVPGQRVLDLTGTKSLELAEALQSEAPDGLLVANNATVPQQLCGVVAFTKCPPQRFPELYEASGEVLKFDRVACHMASSGDEARLQPWHMHPLQLRALQRGLKALAVGGRLLYSTLSSNVIENEAVVASALATSEAVLLELNWKDWQPEAVRLTWSVPDPRSNAHFDSWEEVPSKARGKVLRTMFPVSVEGLQRCLRASNGSAAFQAPSGFCFLRDSSPAQASIFMAVFEKRPASTSKAVAKVVAPEVSDTLAGFPPGSRVRVKSNGAPAVIVGPGQKAFKGGSTHLIRILQKV